jgi:hypothetical protein
MCSSRSGHSIAYPSPNNCQFCRSTGEAYSKRGYQAKGTRIRRPSERLTVRSSSVTLTFTAIGSISSTVGILVYPYHHCTSNLIKGFLHDDTPLKRRVSGTLGASRAARRRGTAVASNRGDCPAYCNGAHSLYIIGFLDRKRYFLKLAKSSYGRN